MSESRRISSVPCDARRCANVAAHLWRGSAAGDYELYLCERHHYYASTGNMVRIYGEGSLDTDVPETVRAG